MSTQNGTTPPEPSVEELQARIEQTRQQLGDTVDALAAKADVKARARERAERTRAALTDDDGRPDRRVVAGAGAAVAVGFALLALRVWRRRR